MAHQQRINEMDIDEDQILGIGDLTLEGEKLSKKPRETAV